MFRPGAELARDVEALLAFVDSRQCVPHASGRHANDCVAFALGAVEAQTGVDPAPGVNWSSPAGALRVIRRFGSLEAAFDAYFERVAPAFAQRGDIAGVPDETFGIHPMIVEGETLVSPGDRGNRRAKRKIMTVAWSAVLYVQAPGESLLSPAHPIQPGPASE